MKFLSALFNKFCDLILPDFKDVDDNLIETVTVDKKNILVRSGDKFIGVCQSVEYRLDFLTIGDRPVITGTISRLRVDRFNLDTCFEKGYFHALKQSAPLTISFEGQTLQNVWLKEAAYVHQADEWLIVEGISFEAESILESK